MNKTQKFIGLLAMAPLLAIAISASPENLAYGYKQSGLNEETKETFFFRGELTQATENNPYGGETLGNYFVQVNVNEVKVITNLDSSQSDGKAMVAWLVDFGGEPAIFLGIFEDNELTTSIPINEWIYEAIILSEVLENLSSSENPLGGSALEKAPKHKSDKSF